MDVLVIGAGIVGLSTAYWLARDGHSVTVVDRAEDVGRGASFANGGQLSYSYVAPMAAPAVLRSLPKWLLTRDGPVRFVPSADPAQWRWILAFLRACTADRSALTTARLLALSFHSRDSLNAMMAALPLDFLHRRNGKLVLHSSRAGLAEAASQVRLQAVMGCEQEMLTMAECIAMEPALQSIAHRLQGGVYTPSEEVGDCRMLCTSLHAALGERPFGVRFLLGRAVDRLMIERGRVACVRTAQGDMTADLFVLCAGVQAAALARPAGVAIAVQPVRGYSISARVHAGNRAPVRSITDSHHKTVYAPLGDTLRVAGFAEIGGGDRRVRRVASLVRELDTVFPGLCALDDVQQWTGQRPLTPTGVPVIGRSRVANLMLNVGQGALGFTLAAGSAHLLADLVAGRAPAVPAEDYAPAEARF